MKLGEKTLSSEMIYEGKIVKLEKQKVELPNGRISSREIVRHGEAVAILPIDQDGNLLLVEQFRKPIDKVILEIPAGLVEPGEEPAQAAARELEEECGVVAGKLEFVVKYYTTPGFSDEMIYLFRATDLKPSQQNMDTDEFLNVVSMPVEEFKRRVLAKELIDGKTVLAYGFLDT